MFIFVWVYSNSEKTKKLNQLGEKVMYTMPKVSVIIAVYNTEDYLRQCLDSVISQTLSDIEIICVNDGSTDKSPEILKEYSAIDHRITIITQENQGPGVARTTGLNLAKGKYLSFLDSDDYFENNMLYTMYTTAEKKNYDIIVCTGNQLNCSTNKTHAINNLPSHYLKNKAFPDPFSAGDIPDVFMQGFSFWAWDKMFKTDLIKGNNITFPKLHGPEDMVFVTQALFMAKRIGSVDQKLFTYRSFRLDSVTNNRKKSPYDLFEAIRMIKTFLIEMNIFTTFENTFINFAASHCIFAIQAISQYAKISKEDSGTFSKVYYYLKDTFIDEMEFLKFPPDYYKHKNDYVDLLFIKERDIVHYFISGCERDLIRRSLEQQSNSFSDSKNREINKKITIRKIIKWLLPYGVVRLVQKYVNNE
jgi:glycosyltransferase involved in cell wall biosynthesis